MTPPINIDGESENYNNVTIDGQTVEQITIDGTPVFSGRPDSGVSRWEFEQDVTDSWDNNDGSDNTSAGFVTGTIGSFAKDFDGTDDFVVVSNNTNIDNLQELSISFWVNWNTKSDFDNTIVKGSDFSNSSSAEWGFQLDSSTDQLLGFIISDGSNTTTVNESSAKSTSTWINYVGTFGSDTVTLYVNGSSDNSASHTGGGVNDDNGRIAIGASTDGGSNYGSHADAAIDEVRIYNKELTSTEVSNLFNTGSI